MKRTLLILSFCGALAACGGNNSDKTADADSAVASDQVAESRNPEVDTSVNNIGTGPETPTTASAGTESGKGSGSEKGKQLITQSDCLTCHKEKEKVVGPAYIDVAKKYEDNDKNLDYLADKIIKGGSGNWGEIPMTPHPAISKDDAKEMAKYVLSLNN
jgi:cytochrome c